MRSVSWWFVPGLLSGLLILSACSSSDDGGATDAALGSDATDDMNNNGSSGSDAMNEDESATLSGGDVGEDTGDAVTGGMADDDPAVGSGAIGGAQPIRLNSDTGDIRWLAKFFVDESLTGVGGRSFAFAEFLSYSRGLELEVFTDFYAIERDTCDLPDPDAEGGGESSPPPYVDAGETVILSSAAGTWATLERGVTDDGERIFYTSLSDVPVNVPDELVIDVPGSADLPPLPSLRMPDVQQLIAVRPIGVEVSADTLWQWQAGTVESSYIRLELRYNGSEPDRELPDTIVCTLADDGEFGFTDEQRERLGEGFQNYEAVLSRVEDDLGTVGDIFILARRSSIF